MIELTNIDKTFQDVHAIDHISAVIQDNLIFGLVGSNGAGKEYADAADRRHIKAGWRKSPH